MNGNDDESHRAATEAAEAVERELSRQPVIHPDAQRAIDATYKRAESEFTEAPTGFDADAATADAQEIIARARSRIGRARWTRADGRALRAIVEILRSLPRDEA